MKQKYPSDGDILTHVFTFTVYRSIFYPYFSLLRLIDCLSDIMAHIFIGKIDPFHSLVGIGSRCLSDSLFGRNPRHSSAVCHNLSVFKGRTRMETIIPIRLMKIIKSPDFKTFIIFERISIGSQNNTYGRIIFLQFQMRRLKNGINTCLKSLYQFCPFWKHNLSFRVTKSGIIFQNLWALSSDHEADKQNTNKRASFSLHGIHCRLINVFLQPLFVELPECKRASRGTHTPVLKRLIAVLGDFYRSCALVIGTMCVPSQKHSTETSRPVINSSITKIADRCTSKLFICHNRFDTASGFLQSLTKLKHLFPEPDHRPLKQWGIMSFSNIVPVQPGHYQRFHKLLWEYDIFSSDFSKSP